MMNKRTMIKAATKAIKIVRIYINNKINKINEN